MPQRRTQHAGLQEVHLPRKERTCYRWFRDQATAATYKSGELSTRATQATHPMALVPSQVIVRSVDAIPPLKFPYFKFKPAVFNGFRLLSGPAMTDHQRRALLRRHEHQTRRCGCYRRHTRRTPLPRPIMAADLGPNVSAAAAAACMSAGGRVWWWAVSRSPAQEHPQRAAALVPMRPASPLVCV